MQYVEKYGLPKLPTNVAETRQNMSERGTHNQSLLSKPPFDILAANVSVTNTHITLPEVASHSFPLRIYKPKDHDEAIDGPLAVMLYFHGGFWVAGDSNAEDFGCRAVVARGTKIIIASFEYRLAPENSWNVVFSDAEYAMKWMASNSSSIGGDISKGFIVGGSTGGAHLAAICAIRARDKYPNITLTGQLLIVPALISWPDDANIPADWKDRLASHIEMSDNPILPSSLYEFYLKTLNVPEDEKRKGENFPMWASLKDLPPAYIPMDEVDPTRDDAFLYLELLQEAGVLTRSDYYPGLCNMFVWFAELETTLTAGIHLTAGMKWLLQKRK
jgi:versiconal hemiacetal acetate esterase